MKKVDKILIGVFVVFIGLMSGLATWIATAGPYAWEHCEDWTKDSEILDKVQTAENGNILWRIILTDGEEYRLWLDGDGVVLR